MKIMAITLKLHLTYIESIWPKNWVFLFPYVLDEMRWLFGKNIMNSYIIAMFLNR